MDILTAHRARYPLMEVRDCVKLLYQAEFGGGHFVQDAQRALERLKEEMSSAPAPDMPLFEDIGQGMRRMRIHENPLSSETVNELFVRCAAEIRGNTERFLEKLKALPESAYIEQYIASGCPAVSHSDGYRAAYHPAYRVVAGICEAFFPLILAIDKALSERDFVLVGIDGMAASGKSTVAQFLADVFGASLFHMDDFFLPFDMRSDARLAEAGGNVHYERFKEEILEPLKRRVPFSYRPFDCGTGEFAGEIAVAPSRLAIVEGAYAFHPHFASPYDLTAFFAIDPALQRARIEKRNGREMLKRFVDEWIPMENTYCEAYSVKERSDFVFAAEDGFSGDALRCEKRTVCGG
ncbi:MAG: uridine kinase family protein [Christensenellales bacterium]|jgi:uridine kinase